MKYRICPIAIFSLIAAAGCGRSVDPNAGKKPIVGDPDVRIDGSDSKTANAVKRPLANDATEQDAIIREYRKAAEELEKSAHQFDQITATFSRNMMFAALAWRKADDKSNALAAAKAAIAAGPDDRSTLDTSLWHMNIGDILLYADEIPLAIEQYQFAVKSDPKSVNAARAQKKLDEAKAKLSNPK